MNNCYSHARSSPEMGLFRTHRALIISKLRLLVGVWPWNRKEGNARRPLRYGQHFRVIVVDEDRRGATMASVFMVFLMDQANGRETLFKPAS
jgi:hypothetical protein